MDILIFLAVIALIVLPRVASISGKRPGAGRPGVPAEARLPDKSLVFSDVFHDEPPPDEIPEAFPAPSMIEWDGNIEDALYGGTREGLTPVAVGEPQRVVPPPEVKPLSRNFAVDPGELRRAIVMAEILSPPKALRRR